MRALGITLVAVGLACGSGSSQRREFDGDQAMRYVEAQVAFGPRVPNTEGHRRMGDWLVEQLTQRADTVEVQGFTHVSVDGDTLHLRNVIARFLPERTDRILYLAHWDTRPHADRSANLGEQRMPIPGANDGASGVAVLLGVADALRLAPPAYGVDLVFVDGEDYGDFGDGRDVYLGSRHYAGSIDPARKPLFAVVWDMVGDADLRFFQEGNSVAGAPEVVERVWRTASDLGYGGVFRSTVGGYIGDDHVPLLEVGVRAIDVIDLDYGPGNSYWHTLEDTVDKLSVESLQTVGDVAVALVR